jgi:hypothetical protein
MIYFVFLLVIVVVMLPSFLLTYEMKAWLGLTLACAVVLGLCAVSYQFFISTYEEPWGAFFLGMVMLLFGAGALCGAIARAVILIFRSMARPLDEARVMRWAIGLMVAGTCSALWIEG